MAGGSSVMRWDAPVVKLEPGSQDAPRRGTAADVEIVLPGRGLQYSGQIADLRVDGCLIATKCKLEAGTAVEVWLRTEGMPLRVAARLVERREAGVAFEFLALPLRKRDQIEALRLELEREKGRGLGNRD
jgi:PilZ domain